MGTLVECLAEKLGEDLRLGANVKSITVRNGDDEDERCWRIRLSSGDEIVPTQSW
jgi:hypothetical protein